MKSMLIEKSRKNVGGTWVNSETRINIGEIFNGQPIRHNPLGLPDVAEVEVVRHFTDLSYQSHGVDNGFYPLGSCTMKYNPKRHERYANLQGFRAIHPFQPVEDIQGTLKLLFNLQGYIAELTGMAHVSLQPAAGAHGEFAGLLVIRKYFETRNEKRKIILIADSAHGTNPSSATMAGYECRIVPTTPKGLLDIHSLREQMNHEVAGLMLTNPSTLGLFEENISEIATIVHEKGGLLYYDGANLNALMGIVRPGDMGFDVIHINTHKTLSTPHGGGGPGAGPLGVKQFLEPFLPVPVVRQNDVADSYWLDFDRPQTIGRVKQHLGHFSVLVKAYSYILAMGPQGLKQASEDAVLNANYLQYHLADILPPVFETPCMHECLLSGDSLPVTPYSFVKRLIDHGIHPPTLVGAGCVYFPSGLKNSMLIEPTETETKASLDHFVNILHEIFREALVDAAFVNQAPHIGKTRKIPEVATVLNT